MARYEVGGGSGGLGTAVDVTLYDSIQDAAAVAFPGGRPLFFPAGTHAFTGDPLDPGGEFTIIGEPGAVITLPEGGYFLETSVSVPSSYVSNVRFSGGAGAFRYLYTGANIGANAHIFDHVEFRGYTVCAWSSESDDFPNIRFHNCQFRAASYDGTIGIALPSRAAGTVIDSCDFQINRIDVKAWNGAPNVYIHNCGFIRQAGAVVQTRIRLWVLPTAFTTAGAGMVVEACKFGNENMVAGDLQIVYADQGAGTFNGDRHPALTTAATGVVSYHTYINNNISLGNGASGSSPLIFSTTPNIENTVAAPNAYQGLAATHLVQYLAALSKANVAVPYQRPTIGLGGQPGGTVKAVRVTDNVLATSSTTLVADSTLAVPVQNAVLYRVEAMLIYDGPTGADLKIGCTVPVGTVQELNVDGLITTTSAAAAAVNRSARLATSDTTSVATIGVGTKTVVWVRGYVTPGINGTWGLTFAQDTSDAAAVTVFTRSRLILTPID